MVRYRSRRPDDADLRRQLNELAQRFPRYGYRQLGDRIRRRGQHHNWKKIYRVYREEQLQVRKRKKKRARGGPRRPLPVPSTINERWSMDFMSDFLQDGRRFRTLNLLDDFSRRFYRLLGNGIPRTEVMLESKHHQNRQCDSKNGTLFHYRLTRELRDRIKSSGTKGMTPQQAFQPQEKSFENSFFLDCLIHIDGTGRLKTARTRQPRRDAGFVNS